MAVYFRGHRFDTQTRDMLAEVERLFGEKLRIAQGSYSKGPNSAGTHSRAGAVDIQTRGMSRSKIERLVKIMRIVGFAAWYRDGSDGFSPHIHGIAVGVKDLDRVAANQVVSLRNGRNGLRSNKRDRHAYMKLPVTTWGAYKARRQKPAKPAPKPNPAPARRSITALQSGAAVPGKAHKQNPDIQGVLNAAGYRINGRSVNFGPQSTAAVIAFHNKNPKFKSPKARVLRRNDPNLGPSGWAYLQRAVGRR